LLIPSYSKTGIDSDVAALRHPTMDYYALQKALTADIADYAVLDACRDPRVAAARRAGRDVGMAMYGFVRRRQFDVIFSNGENVGIPLAALFATVRRRPGHVLIGHYLSPAKKKVPFRLLHRNMDGF